MKTRAHSFYLLAGLLSIFCTIARADEPPGIKFFTGSWQNVLAEAKRQNKPIFVDVYTTWCGPCKQMAKEAFPDAKVGEKFNTSFVNYQIDAEKGEGRDIAKKYAVAAYPTSLYVLPDGSQIQRTVGYGGIKGMLEQANQALVAANDPNPLSAMEKQYKDGKHDPEFLAAYLQKRATIDMPNDEALNAYLKTVPEAEWSTDKNIALIAGNATTYNPRILDLLLQKLLDVKEVKGEQAMAAWNKLGNRIYTLNEARFDKAVIDKDEELLADVIKTSKAYESMVLGRTPSSDHDDEMAGDIRMRFYQQTKNMGKYSAITSLQAGRLMKLNAADMEKLNEEAYQRFKEETRYLPDSVKQTDNFKQYAASMKKAEPKQTAMKLNNLAWAYYENIIDKKALGQALTWSAKSLEYDRTGMYLDTYAHLLSKLGRKAEAIKTQQEAIANEKAAGRETTVYEKELAIMKKK